MGKILFVEDEHNLRRLYVEELEIEGHQVIAVDRGVEAVRVLEDTSVDLVVLDLVLPNGNDKEYGSGLDYLQEMLNRRRDLKIIINSAYPDFKVDFRSWGAERFLTKSSDLTELKDTISELIAKPQNQRMKVSKEDNHGSTKRREMEQC